MLAGWFGNQCQNQDLCFGKRCSDNGVCVGGKCTCDEGFLGEECDRIDPCRDISCRNNGTCLDGLCVCRDAFKGALCEYENGCFNSSICGAEGECISDDLGTPNCKCNAGFNGTFCRQQITCENFICATGKVCVEEGDKVPKCLSQPTQPGATPTQFPLPTFAAEGGEELREGETAKSGNIAIGEPDESSLALSLPLIIILAVVGAILITAVVLGALFLRTRRRATGTYR